MAATTYPAINIYGDRPAGRYTFKLACSAECAGFAYLRQRGTGAGTG